MNTPNLILDIPKHSIHETSLYWHHRFMTEAKAKAEWSKDPHNQIGSVLVNPKKNIVSSGFNGLPREMDDNLADWDDPQFIKDFVIHAEMNAILTAADNQARLDNCIAYVTRPPCPRCCGALKQVGIHVAVTSPLTEHYLKDHTLEELKDRYRMLKFHVFILHEDRLEGLHERTIMDTLLHPGKSS